MNGFCECAAGERTYRGRRTENGVGDVGGWERDLIDLASLPPSYPSHERRQHDDYRPYQTVRQGFDSLSQEMYEA